MERIFYIAQFHKEGNGCWVSFPDFPECFTQGNTLIDTFKYAQEALELCIEERIFNKETLPEPTLSKDIKDENSEVVLLHCDKVAA